MVFIVRFLDTALGLYRMILLARILISWFPNIDRSNQIVRFIYDVTEPVLRPFRNFIPPIGGVDFSPILVFFLLDLLRRSLWRMLIWLIF